MDLESVVTSACEAFRVSVYAKMRRKADREFLAELIKISTVAYKKKGEEVGLEILEAVEVWLKRGIELPRQE